MALILILAGCLLLGWLVGAALRQKTADWLETAVLSILIGVSLFGWLGVLLAELGWFSLATLMGSWLLLVGLFALVAWQRRTVPIASIGQPNSDATWFPFVPKWVEAVALAVWLLAAAWLFLRPHEFVLGAADAGVYVNLGAAIAEEGTILQPDPFLAVLDPAFYPAFLRSLPQDPVAPYYLLPAFYLLPQAQGELTPQFYPGHPVWLAIAYSVSGQQVAAMLQLVGLWALLALLVVYLIGRQLGGWQTAVLLLAGLTLNALQIWFARYPTAETLSQYLLWGGLWCLGQWLASGERHRLWALAAGLALGQFFLVRIDAVIILPVLGVLALWQLARRGWTRLLLWFWLPLLVAVVHAFVHGLWQSEPYFYSVFGSLQNTLQRNWLFLLGMLLLALPAGWLFWRQFGFSLQPVWQRRLKIGLIVTLLLWAAYGWFVRPYVNVAGTWLNPFSETPDLLTNHENWLRLGWYLSAAGVWLGMLGSCWLLWRVERKTAVFLAIGLLFALVYLTNNRASPLQIYVMRRYVPAVLPLFSLGTAVLLGAVAVWKRPFSPLLALAIALVWLAGLGWSARGFISQVDYAGLTAQLDAFDSQLQPHSILLFNEQATVGSADRLGTPLKFLYGHDVLILRDPAAISAADLRGLLAEWRENGRFVYWLGDATWLNEQGIDYTASVVEINTHELESSFSAKPQQVNPLQFRYEVARLK